MNNYFDQEYLNLCKNILDDGYMEYNERTGKNCLKIHGAMMKFDLSEGMFPLLTLRKMHTKGIFSELLGFIRGYDNASQFRNIGCNLWNANANKSKHWLENPNRIGKDHLGRIYGVQARDWQSYDILNSGNKIQVNSTDQLKIVVDKLTNNIDDRRLIVTHWNPGELNKMALPPCHMFYQFGLRGDVLDLAMYQRSADVPLGVPSNIASYALLLLLVARITNKKPGIFTHMLFNCHFYEDQIDKVKELVQRPMFNAPQIQIDENIKSLIDLETWVTTDNFKLIDYKHGAPIEFPFSE